MNSNPSTSKLYSAYNPWMLLLVTLGVTMVGFQFIGAFFGLSLSYFFYLGDMEMYFQAMRSLEDEAMRTPFLIMQGVGSLTGFIILPWLLLKYFYKGHVADLGGKINNPLLVLTIFITLFFMGFNAPFIEWNQNFSFPEAFAGLEEKLKALEDTLAKTSEFITHFDSWWQLALGVSCSYNSWNR